MDYRYNYGVIIGRFQPFHKGHVNLIEEAMKIAKTIIIVIGSATGAVNIKNPWTYEQRKDMILSVFNNHENKIQFIGARDYFYQDNMWVTEIQQKINMINQDDDNTCIIGTYKDSSSYYLRLFPQWDLVPTKIQRDYLSSTDIRNSMYNRDTSEFKWEDNLPNSVVKYLHDDYLTTEIYKNMIEEHQFVQNYKTQWKDSPFPPIFSTVDNVVFKSGHVLVIKRGANPGKGLYAIPGGFLKETKTLKQTALDELKEETRIPIDKVILEKHIFEEKTFDYVGRSTRGRTITQAFAYNLGDGNLPLVKGSDDASWAGWVPLMDILTMENKFYEDHFHIINYFVNRF